MERKFHANFTLGNESSMGRKFQGTKVPGNEGSRGRKFQGKIQGTKVPPMELSFPGTKVLGYESSSYPDTHGRSNATGRTVMYIGW